MTETEADAAVVAGCAVDLIGHLDRIASHAAAEPLTADMTAALDVAWQHVTAACAVLADRSL